MNSFKITHAFRLVLVGLVATGALVLAGNLDQIQAQTIQTKTKNTTRWEWTDDGWRRRVEIQGKAEFPEDYSDVIGLSEGGFVRLEEDLNGQSSRLEVRRDQSGQLIRRYFVNGESRALDEEGKKWVAALLLTAVRQGAIDADGRVKTLMRKRGVAGVLEEITSIKSDYAKRIYFQALLKNESLNRVDLPHVAEALITQIRSDYEKANLLKNSADVFLTDSSISKSYFQAVTTIESDYEQRQLLSALLKKNNLTPAVLAQMLDSVATISSDYEKATFLLEASRLYTGNADLRNAFLRATETIKSEYERGRVLSVLLRNKQIG